MELRTPDLPGVDLLPQWQDLPNPYASVTRCDLHGLVGRRGHGVRPADGRRRPRPGRVDSALVHLGLG